MEVERPLFVPPDAHDRRLEDELGYLHLAFEQGQDLQAHLQALQGEEVVAGKGGVLRDLEPGELGPEPGEHGELDALEIHVSAYGWPHPFEDLSLVLVEVDDKGRDDRRDNDYQDNRREGDECLFHTGSLPSLPADSGKYP